MSKELHAIFCSLVMMCAADAATSKPKADGDTPPVRRVESKLARDAARFAMLYAQPSTPWQSHYNRPNGWTVALLMVPDPGSPGLQYELDGSQLSGDDLPIFRFDHTEPFVLEPPDVLTPVVGYAHAKFGLPSLDVDLPMTALGGTASGAAYELQLYTLTPVDTTDLSVVVRLDLVGCFTGTIKEGSLTFASPCPPAPPPASDVLRTIRTMSVPLVPAATTSWGAMKAIYR